VLAYKSTPCIAAKPVQHLLQVDLAHPLQRAAEEGVHGDQITREVDLDLMFPELRVEPLQRADLLIRELQLPLPGRGFEP
jgi:hypothetical protein